MENHNKILLLIDGSERALDAVRYISSIEAFSPMTVVLLSISTLVPESYLDLERSPQGSEESAKINEWQILQKKKREQYMEQALQLLKQGGYENVLVKIQPRVRGIARDIITEASKGYDAVVFARRGTGLLAGIPVGSVATKLLNHLSFAPLIMVSENIRSNRLIVGVDGSQNALKAVDFVGKMLGGKHEVELIHIIRNADSDDSPLMMADAESRKHSEKMEATLEKMKDRLADHGFDRDNIATKIVTGAFSRAGAILDEAIAGGFDTVVLGRRGVSKVEDFQMGRVSNKVIHAGNAFTTWLV